MRYKAVIVNYNKTEAMKVQLRQLSEQTLPPNAVAIIDNSPVCTVEQREIDGYGFAVDLQHHPENLGYSKACNLGCDGDWDYVVFLNPDIEISDQELFEKLLGKTSGINDLGCAGVVQRNPDGSYEGVARKFPSIVAIMGKRVPALRGIFAKSVENYLESYPCGYKSKAPPLVVDWLQSSFLLVPRSTWEECGGFEERFFVFMADTEYGFRCKKHGLNSYLFRDIQVEADGLRSSAGGVMDIFKRKTIRIHLRDAFRYYSGL